MHSGWKECLPCFVEHFLHQVVSSFNFYLSIFGKQAQLFPQINCLTPFWQNGETLEAFSLSFLFPFVRLHQVPLLKYTLAQGLFGDGLCLKASSTYTVFHHKPRSKMGRRHACLYSTQWGLYGILFYKFWKLGLTRPSMQSWKKIECSVVVYFMSCLYYRKAEGWLLGQ